MIVPYNVPPTSLGLRGDGDEIAAIAEVERKFGVQLDYSGAQHWMTVGDVFEALKRVLPSGQSKPEETWSVFTRAICEETGVDPARVTTKTLLLGKSKFDWRMGFVLLALMAAVFAGLWAR